MIFKLPLRPIFSALFPCLRLSSQSVHVLCNVQAVCCDFLSPLPARLIDIRCHLLRLLSLSAELLQSRRVWHIHAALCLPPFLDGELHQSSVRRYRKQLRWAPNSTTFSASRNVAASVHMSKYSRRILDVCVCKHFQSGACSTSP